MKKEKEEKKEETAVEKRLGYLERELKRVIIRLEKQFGVDLNDNDIIGGYAKPMLLGLLGLVMIVGFALAAEDVQVRYRASEGNDAVIQLEADEGDDAADELEIIMKAGGTAAISVGGTEALTLGQSGLTKASSTSITVTNNQEITPTYAVYFLTPAASPTTVSVANATSGQLLTLINVAGGSTNIFIDDANNMKTSADTDLNQFDSLALIGYSTNWIEYGQGNN